MNWESFDAIHLIRLASAIVALVTFAIGYVVASNRWRRNNTLKLIGMIFSSPVLASGHAYIARMIAEGRELSGDAIPKEVEQKILPVLEFYNFLCISAHQKGLHRYTLVRHRGISIRDTFYCVKGYIDARREKLNRPGLYCDIEEFVEKNVQKRDH